LCDFGDAIRRSIDQNYPESQRYGDWFHFMKDNIDWMRKHQGQDLLPQPVNTLRCLCFSKDYSDFITNRDLYVSYWCGKHPDYARYFQRVWLKTHKPEEWAVYGRPDDISSGSNHIEAWHRRLKGFDCKTSMAIDYLLSKEAQYQISTITNTILLNDRLKDLEE